MLGKFSCDWEGIGIRIFEVASPECVWKSVESKEGLSVMLSISTKFRHGNHMKSDEESSGLLTDMRMYSYSMRVHGWQTYTVMLICIRRGSHCSHYLTSDSSGII